MTANAADDTAVSGKACPAHVSEGASDELAAIGTAQPIDQEIALPSSRYVVQCELGRGGMGTVEEVIDARTGERLALKRLLLEEASSSRHAQMLSLFQQEFHVLSHLHHPRIVKVQDYGTDSVGPYYTMELVQGRDLHELGVLPWRHACRIARDVVSSLAIIHGRRLVHRDVTPRNIRVDALGNGKLMDFGAMTPVGVRSALIVGTPPFIPPEAVQQVGLDGRADLFSLGATLYWCLTGRQAYPARSLHHLPDLWRSPPQSPRFIVPEIPVGLDTLVMELINVSPMARPLNAAVVFERIIAIAGLSRDEALEVSASYLSSSVLVGRDSILGDCRKNLLSSMRGRARAVMITGPRGSGRSRVLDAAVLEGTMVGALVLKADDCDTSENFALLKRLARSLVLQRPEVRRLHPGLEPLLGETRIANSARTAVQTAFENVVCGYSKSRHLMIAVDDIDRVDEPSLACLASLASQSRRHRLYLIVTSRQGSQSRSDAAMHLLEEVSRGFEIPSLTFEQVEGLLRSMFGDVDNLGVVCGVLFERSMGNPGRVMRDAQAMAHSKLVRYGAGSWILPASPADFLGELPKDSDSRQRIAEVTEFTQALVELVALDVHGHVRAQHCSMILLDAKPGELQRAFDTLAAVDLLRRAGDGSGVLILANRAEILPTISEERRIKAHRLLAGWYVNSEYDSAYGYHATSAGDWVPVLTRVLKIPLEELRSEWLRDPTALTTLEKLIQYRHCEQPDAPDLLRLRTRLLALAVDAEDWVCVFNHAELTLTELTARCGLTDYAGLGGLREGPRLTRAIEIVEERQAFRLRDSGMKESDGMSLTTAFEQLPAVMLSTASAAVLAVAPQMTQAIPSLAPLYGLSPAFPIVDELTQAIIAVGRGQIASGLDAMRKLNKQLSANIAGLETQVHTNLVDFCTGFLQGIETTIAAAGVLERCDVTERRSTKRAERDRFSYYNAIGDVELARAARRRLERLEVQGGSLKHFPTTWEIEFSFHALTRNIDGLKRCERQARKMAKLLPGWVPRESLASIAQAQCSASTAETIQRSERLMHEAMSGSGDRRYAFYLLTDALIEVGEYQRCVDVAMGELSRLDREPQWHEGYMLHMAEARAYLGDHAQAKRDMQSHLAMYLEAGVGGLLLGRTYETAARVALLGGDGPLFVNYAEKCAGLYRSGFNPTLSARYERLMRQARESKISVSASLQQAAQFEQRAEVSEFLSTFRTEIGAHAEPASGYQHTLEMLVEGTAAQTGVLYLARGAELHRAATTGDSADDKDLDSQALEFWVMETAGLETEVIPNTLVAQDPTSGVGQHNLPHGGLTAHLFLLTDGCRDHERACGVLTLLSAGEARAPNRNALIAFAQLLLEQDGIDGLACD